jgi:hypothetical protein
MTRCGTLQTNPLTLLGLNVTARLAVDESSRFCNKKIVTVVVVVVVVKADKRRIHR